MNNYYYTNKEKSLIKKLYPTTSTKVLAKRLGVKPRTLNAKALKWGIVKKNKWWPNEIQFLKDNCLQKSAVQIARELKKDVSAVRDKAGKLRLYFNRWTNEEITYLRKVYKDGGYKAFAEKYPDKSFSTVSAKARTLKITAQWSIQTIRLLKQNFRKTKYSELARILNKSQSAVEHKLTRLKLIKKNTSYLENDLKLYLDKQGIRHKTQTQISKYRVDFLIDNNIVLETNGSYWHCDKRVFPNPINDQQTQVLIKDKHKYKLLRSLGYRLIILWEKDINEDFSKIANGIYAVINGDIDEYNSAKSVNISKRKHRGK